MSDRIINNRLDPIRVRKRFGEQGRTHQEMGADCDINTIVRRFMRTGQLVHINPKAGVYGDFSNSGDFQTAMEAIRAAEAIFGSLPARVRKLADNDPGRLLDLVNDPEAHEALQAAGLDVGWEPPAPPEEASSEAKPPPSEASVSSGEATPDQSSS